MGLETLDPNYSEGQFADALQQLLPPGEYWNHNGEPSELKQVLDGLGAELKAVHDETKLNFLFEIDNNLLGWKVADFQSILDINNLPGRVFDHPSTPNLIYLEIDDTSSILPIFQQIQTHRLPHTQLVWRLVGGLGLKVAIRATVYQRLTTEG